MRIIHFEAVNFAETVFDSAELKLIRGGSAVVALAPEVVVSSLGIEPENVATFSSTAVIRDEDLPLSRFDEVLNANSDSEDIQNSLASMCFMWGEGSGDTFLEAWMAARKSATQLRFRRLTTMPLQDEDPREALGKISWRRKYYSRVCDWEEDDVELPEDLQKLRKPQKLEAAKKLSQAIALIYFDADNAGKLLQVDDFNEFRERSISFARWRSQILLGLLKASTISVGDSKTVFMETLFHGADESMVVVPAWNLLNFIRALEVALKDRPNHFESWTHSISIVVCNEKTPIRMVMSSALDIAKNVKRIRRLDSESGHLSDYPSENVFLFLSNALGAPIGSLTGILENSTREDVDNMIRMIILPLDQLGAMLSEIQNLEGVASTLRRTESGDKDGPVTTADQPISSRRRTEKFEELEKLFQKYLETPTSNEDALAARSMFLARYLFEMRGQYSNQEIHS